MIGNRTVVPVQFDINRLVYSLDLMQDNKHDVFVFTRHLSVEQNTKRIPLDCINENRREGYWWSHCDLNTRPSGYQPDAQTVLSYGTVLVYRG